MKSIAESFDNSKELLDKEICVEVNLDVDYMIGEESYSELISLQYKELYHED